MKAQNETTGHNRTLHLTGLKGGDSMLTDLTELTIKISYVDDDVSSRLSKALTLDHEVIPAIIKALNKARS